MSLRRSRRGGDLKADDAKPVEEVLSKCDAWCAWHDGLGRCRDDAGFRPECRLAAHAFERSVFEDAQESCLHCEVEIPDLVDEERPVRRKLEPALTS
jgi:hypothetical protein